MYLLIEINICCETLIQLIVSYSILKNKELTQRGFDSVPKDSLLEKKN